MLMTMMGFFCGIVDRGITGGGLYPVYFQQVISPQAVNEKRTHIHQWSSLKMYIQLNTNFNLFRSLVYSIKQFSSITSIA